VVVTVLDPAVASEDNNEDDDAVAVIGVVGSVSLADGSVGVEADDPEEDCGMS
jgi:hypothetical protein